MAKSRFIIRVQATNLRAEVWVNNMPVCMLLPGQALSPVALPVNQFLIAGRNTVGVVLHAGAVPSKASEEWSKGDGASAYSGPASLRLTLAEYDDEQTDSAYVPAFLTTLDWEGEACPRPAYVEREFSLSKSVGPWSWETARTFRVLDPTLREQVLDYVKSLHNLLAVADFNGFVSESAIKLNELTAQAYGVSAEYMRNNMLQALKVHSEPPYGLRALNLQEIDLRLVAGGRLIECLRKDRGYVLEYKQPQKPDTFFLPLMVGQFDNRWRILR